MCGIVWSQFQKSRRTSPTYEGKTVQEWFYGSNGHCGRENTIESAKLAFTQLGTNCVPFLLENLRRRESSLKVFYVNLFSKLPNSVKSKLKPPLKVSYIQMITFVHLRELLPGLDSVADELMEILPTIEDTKARSHGFRLVVGPLAIRHSSIEKRRDFFSTFLRDPSFEIQLEAAILLSQVDNSVTNGIPILLNAITNRNIVTTTVRSAGSWPSGMLQDQVKYKQRRARTALRNVSPSIAESNSTPALLPAW